jgi:hypothetical protein
MNESKRDVSSRRRRFTEEFKRDAVRLVVEEKYSFKAVYGMEPIGAKVARGQSEILWETVLTMV